MTAQTARPAALGKRQRFMLFAPIAILLGAAVLTNLGGGFASHAKAANSVTVSSDVQSDRHITSTCGTAGTDGTIGFGTINASTAYDNNASPCGIVFGSTQASTNLQVAASATNLGWTGFAAVGTTCVAAAAGQIGIRADSASTATPVAPFNCADGSVRQANTAATTLCSAVAGADLRCDLVVGFNTGTVTSGARSGVITTSLT